MMQKKQGRLKKVIAAMVLLFCAFWVIANSRGVLFSNQELAELRKKYGKQALKRGKAINRLMKSLRSRSEKQKLTEINNFFNRARYVSDRKLWHKEDYWASPMEFVGKNQGDCEDYVIAKYFALRKLGIADKKLFLTYVRATKQKVAHMVLTYFERADQPPLVLDNYNKKIMNASKRTDLIPVYSFNASSLFLSNSAAGLGKALPNTKMKNSKWRQLIEELNEEAL